MAIRIPPDRLDQVLADALAAPIGMTTWDSRIERVCDGRSKTFVAALGGVLLAKAADPEINVMLRRKEAGPKAYYHRIVTEHLADWSSRHGIHLGARGRNPVNNSPFNAGEMSFETLTKIGPASRDQYSAFLTILRDLEAHPTEAPAVLTRFLQMRKAFADAEAAERREQIASSTRSIQAVLSAIERFVAARSEEGRRAQAAVAAILDACGHDVYMVRVNDPSAFDVEVRVNGNTIIGIEVKDKVVGHDEVDRVIADASASGAPRCWLVATAAGQPSFDNYTLAIDGLRSHGVIFHGFPTIRDFLHAQISSPAIDLDRFCRDLPTAMTRRISDVEAAPATHAEWVGMWEHAVNT